MRNHAVVRVSMRAATRCLDDMYCNSTKSSSCLSYISYRAITSYSVQSCQHRDMDRKSANYGQFQVRGRT
jgi:hypothetical protein